MPRLSSLRSNGGHGWLSRIAKDFDKAEAEFENAAQLDPSDPQPHFLLAQLYRDLRQAAASSKELAAFQELSQKEKDKKLSAVDRQWRTNE